MERKYVKSQIDVYKNKIRSLELDLERAKQANESRDALVAEYTSISNLMHAVEQYESNLKVIQERARKENEDFRTRRLEALNVEITDTLAKIFPEDKYQVTVTCDFNRTDKVTLTIKDQKGNEFSPDICNGKLLQYLVSFSGISCITKSLGKNGIYIDEAFGASSMENLPIIGDMLKRLAEGGTQIVLVSQNPALYMDIPRREIHLVTDRCENCAKVEKVLEFS